MKFRIGLFSVLFLLLVSTLSPLLVSADSDSQSIVRQRASSHEFLWDGSATTVEVMGEWDGWTHGTPMVEFSTNQWSANIEIDPGMYCYKFVIDGNWTIDSSNPYRGYCDSFENSIARVANDTRPMFTHSIQLV